MHCYAKFHFVLSQVFDFRAMVADEVLAVDETVAAEDKVDFQPEKLGVFLKNCKLLLQQ